MFFYLYNGLEIPVLAFGTYNKNIKNVFNLVNDAIDVGFRHFDTATLYKNEEQVGLAISSAIKNKNLLRENFFLTSKLPMNGMNRVDYFFERSLKKLNTTYLDLYLIHAPFSVQYLSDENFYPTKSNILLKNDIDYVDTWKFLEKLYLNKKVKSIGVSNFNIKQLKRLIKSSKIKPMVNQVECHIFFQNKELRNFCNLNGIKISAFAPLGSPLKCNPNFNILMNENLIQIAKKYVKTPAQIALKFLIQSNIIVIPSAEDKNQMLENIQSNEFTLNENDIKTINLLDLNKRIFYFDYVQGVRNHVNYPFDE